MPAFTPVYCVSTVDPNDTRQVLQGMTFGCDDLKMVQQDDGGKFWYGYHLEVTFMFSGVYHPPLVAHPTPKP